MFVLERIDFAIIGAFLLWSLVSGLRARRVASRDLEEYFLAGRTLRGWQAGISMAASQFAADTPLLVTGLIATAGIFSLWRLWIYALSFLLVGFVLAACWRRANVLTDAELTELRYGGRAASQLRVVKAVYFGGVFNCTVLAMVLFAATAIAEPFLLWDRWLPSPLFAALESSVRAVGVPFAHGASTAGDPWLLSTNNLLSVLAIAGITALYSATGGLRAVVRTDIAQFALAMAGSVLYAVWVVREVGGFGALHARLYALESATGPEGLGTDALLAFTPDLAANVALPLLAVIGLQWLVQMNADGTGYLAQRVMACRSERDARQATIVFTLAQVLLRSLIWLPIGLGLLLLFPVEGELRGDALIADREATFVRGIRDLLPPGVRGLMLAAMLAALASTVDTHLNWGASYWTNDIYRRLASRRGRVPSGHELVWVARASTVGVLVLALAIMTQLGSLQTAWETSLLLGAGMGVMLLLRWLWWRISARGELSAIVASLILAPLVLWLLPPEHAALRLLIVAAGSTAAGVGVSLWLGAEDPAQTRVFYERVRPPGFWAPVAAACRVDARHDARRLARGLAATGATALAIFCLLTGAGSWLAGSTAPFGLPSRTLWIAGLLALGACLLPLGLYVGRSPRFDVPSEDGADGESYGRDR
jgi:SSS family solute:Na+ symporter